VRSTARLHYRLNILPLGPSGGPAAIDPRVGREIHEGYQLGAPGRRASRSIAFPATAAIVSRGCASPFRQHAVRRRRTTRCFCRPQSRRPHDRAHRQPPVGFTVRRDAAPPPPPTLSHTLSDGAAERGDDRARVFHRSVAVVRRVLTFGSRCRWSPTCTSRRATSDHAEEHHVLPKVAVRACISSPRAVGPIVVNAASSINRRTDRDREKVSRM